MKVIILVALLYTPFDKNPLTAETYYLTGQYTMEDCHERGEAFVTYASHELKKYGRGYVCYEAEIQLPGEVF